MRSPALGELEPVLSDPAPLAQALQRFAEDLLPLVLAQLPRNEGEQRTRYAGWAGWLGRRDREARQHEIIEPLGGQVFHLRGALSWRVRCARGGLRRSPVAGPVRTAAGSRAACDPLGPAASR